MAVDAEHYLIESANPKAARSQRRYEHRPAAGDAPPLYELSSPPCFLLPVTFPIIAWPPSFTDVLDADELGAALRQLPVPSSAFVLEIFVTVSSTNEYPTDDSLCSSQDQ